MIATHRMESDRARGISAAITVAVASWFTLVFTVTVGGLLLGA